MRGVEYKGEELARDVRAEAAGAEQQRRRTTSHGRRRRFCFLYPIRAKKEFFMYGILNEIYLQKFFMDECNFA